MAPLRVRRQGVEEHNAADVPAGTRDPRQIPDDFEDAENSVAPRACAPYSFREPAQGASTR